jgi:hypothetical protein|tara:strand:+ start:12 stop:224 length:213 start_codon:yes stop_codon:yes gene_type:complete
VEKHRTLAEKRRDEIVSRYGGRNLARILGISHPAVSKWKIIPPLRAFQIANLGDYKMEYIRPDYDFSPSV